MKVVSFLQAIGPARGVEKLSQDSQTVPDMSLSVKEILQRYRRGTLDISTLTRPSYPENDDIDDDTLDDVDDLVDVQQKRFEIHGKVREVLRANSSDTPVDPVRIGETAGGQKAEVKEMQD